MAGSKSLKETVIYLPFTVQFLGPWLTLLTLEMTMAVTVKPYAIEINNHVQYVLCRIRGKDR